MHIAVCDGRSRTAVKVGRRLPRIGAPSAAAASTGFWQHLQMLSYPHKPVALLQCGITQLQVLYDAGLVRMAASVSNLQLLQC